MGLLEKVYDKSPIFFQNIMVTVAGYKKNKNRYGNLYFEYRDFLKEFDKLPLKEKYKYQNKELKRFINYAYNNSPFYNELYQGVKIDKIKSKEGFM